MPTLDELLEGLPSGAEALFGGAVPFFLALLLGAMTLRAGSGTRTASAGAALGLVLGYISTHLVLWGLPPLPPIYASDWLLLIAVLALSTALWAETREQAGPLGLGIHVTTAIAAVALTIRPRILAARWETTEAITQTLLVGGPLLLAWLLAVRGARRRPARESLAAMLMVAGAMALAIGMSGSQKLAQAAGGLAAGLAGLWLAGARDSGLARGLGAGAAVIAVALTGGLALNGTLYAELGRDLYWLGLAPFALLPFAGLLPVPGRGPLRDLLRATLIASPALVAAAIALTRFEVDDSGGYY